MRNFIMISLAINICVLIPICFGLFTHAFWIEAVYRADSPARNILLAVYVAILVLSIWQVFDRNPNTIVAILLLQVVYKVVSPITVGSLSNPVVISNLAIAAFHTVTIIVILRQLRA